MNDVAFLPLTKGKTAIVDAAEVDRLSRHKWTAVLKNSGGLTRWYAFRQEKGKTRYLHHAVLPHVPGLDVDHKNTDGLDCRRENLRYLTRSENNANRRKRLGLSSQYKGVTWDLRLGFWRAQIQSNHRHFTLGLFSIERDAAKAYNRAAVRLFGKAARLNQI